MNDKELLELAAKAIGYSFHYYQLGGWYGWEDENGNFIDQWNPLTDDGDRYRLIKQLGIIVNFKCQYAEYEGICVCWPLDAEDDAYAVVMLAAEIGRMM